ncbi:MAG: DUF1835 domain-containing protein [Gammaproteobacteria bacterium]|nr:DUF1835 domain-containing protein [Gammaproteobacteria bacterium]
MTIAAEGIHVINGLSAAGTWNQAHHMTNRLLVNQDIFSCGPTPYCSDLHIWEQTRIEFIRKLYPDWPEMDFQGFDNDLLRNIARLSEAPRIYLWMSTGLEDQLLLLFLVHVAALVGTDVSRINLVQYESASTRKFPIRLTGELSPQQMLDHPQPKPLTVHSLDYCRDAWRAVTNKSPEMLSALATAEAAPLPHVQAGLRTMCRRYPDAQSGLTFWDRQLLPNILEKGPSAARVIGYTMCGDLADPDCVGDGYLFYRMRCLGNENLPVPLVDLGGTKLRIRETTASLTDAGREVCSGERSSYPANPIDEWIGGCHLSSAESRLWFYESGNLVNAA